MNTNASISYISSSYVVLTRTCHQKCGFCSFSADDSPLLSIEELKSKLSNISRKNASEVVFVAGENPQDLPHIQIDLHRNGFSSFADYVCEASRIAIAEGLLPTVSIGHIDAFLAERFSNTGCLIRANLVCSSLSAHDQALSNSRGRNPSTGKAMIEALHAAEVPYSIGFIIGIGEKEEERLSFVEDVAKLCTADPLLQDVRVMPFQPTPGCNMYQRPPLAFAQIKSFVKAAKNHFPVHHISIPPHLCSKFTELTEFGLNDLGSVPMITGDPSYENFKVPDFETLKRKLEKTNVYLYERTSLSTNAALNKAEIANTIEDIRKQIERRNSAGLNLIDNDHCFVCGNKNPMSLKIPIKDHVNGHTCTFSWTAGPCYQGYAGIVHGGILSTLLDEAMVHAVMGKDTLAVTADIHVKFMRPAPIGVPLKFIANRVAQRKHLHFAKATVILPNGTVLADAEGRFAEI